VRIIDHPLLASRAFFPRPARPAEVFPVETSGAVLACYRAAPHAEALTAIHFHGNGEVVADYVPGFVNLLVDLGVNVVLAEYRGYGGSTGKPTLGGLLDDAEAVLAAIRVPAERVIAFGRSMGSYAAIELAGRHRLAGLVIDSGIADAMERILLRVSPQELGVSRAALVAEVKQLLDHERKLARHRAPILVMHAVRDDLVDASHAVRLASWAASDDKELVLFPRGGHNDLFSQNREQYVDALRGFVARVRRGGGSSER
jgi:pimeloyl-ACP methyl ester carboxylesterase